MGLDELRKKINGIDAQLAKLFDERMEICRDVARYKIENGLPVFQKDRENEIIIKVRESAPKGMEGAHEVLFSTVMDISKSLQYAEVFEKEDAMTAKQFSRDASPTVACPGTFGSYSHKAVNMIFKDCNINFFADFEDVFKDVLSGKADFGILPVQNSTAGSVAYTYELMRKYDFHICASARVQVSHCLCVKSGTYMQDIEEVFSHEQALAQCSRFLAENGLKHSDYANTALAAEFVAKSPEKYAAICSKDCAEKLGLKILSDNIANEKENYTRFILISKDVYTSPEADTVSVALSLSHTHGSLYRLLTKFSVEGLNLTRIESRPIAGTDFEVLFYLDFCGSLSSKAVSKLVSELKSELDYFKFLGNYYEITP